MPLIHTHLLMCVDRQKNGRMMIATGRATAAAGRKRKQPGKRSRAARARTQSLLSHMCRPPCAAQHVPTTLGRSSCADPPVPITCADCCFTPSLLKPLRYYTPDCPDSVVSTQTARGSRSTVADHSAPISRRNANKPCPRPFCQCALSQGVAGSNRYHVMFVP